MDGLGEERSEESGVWRLEKKCNKTIKKRMTRKKRKGMRRCEKNDRM